MRGLLQFSVQLCCSTVEITQSCLGSICSQGLRCRTTFSFADTLLVVQGDGWMDGCVLRGSHLRGARSPEALVWLERKCCVWKSSPLSSVLLVVCVGSVSHRAVASPVWRVGASRPGQNVLLLHQTTPCCLVAVISDAASTLSSHPWPWGIRGCLPAAGAEKGAVW